MRGKEEEKKNLNQAEHSACAHQVDYNKKKKDFFFWSWCAIIYVYALLHVCAHLTYFFSGDKKGSKGQLPIELAWRAIRKVSSGDSELQEGSKWRFLKFYCSSQRLLEKLNNHQIESSEFEKDFSGFTRVLRKLKNVHWGFRFFAKFHVLRNVPQGNFSGSLGWVLKGVQKMVRQENFLGLSGSHKKSSSRKFFRIRWVITKFWLPFFANCNDQCREIVYNGL